MDIFEKLKILTDAAKYDVACTSSGVDKKAAPGGIGNATLWVSATVFRGMGAAFPCLRCL
jgi:predicted DNA-binding helix-hairpin-helix protein